jgi:membrane-associated protein
MEMLHGLIDYILHVDKHLEALMGEYQLLSYGILCLIIFCETGLVATPFLPGDSLLFAAGAIVAKTGILNVWLLIPLLFGSAILGDNVNYFVGKYFGTRLFEMKGFKKILRKEYLDRTHAFYEKHGGKTIIMARFIPIIRTFAPFVAGVGAMDYRRYIVFCIAGGIAWVSLLTLSGYYLGSNPWVKDHFELVVFGIIGVSVLPVIFAFFKSRMDRSKLPG